MTTSIGVTSPAAIPQAVPEDVPSSKPRGTTKIKLDLYAGSNFTKISTLLINSHKWCVHGVISALPFTVKLLQNARYYLNEQQHYVLNKGYQFTAIFFRTALGKQFLSWENRYVASRRESLSITVAKEVFNELSRKALEVRLEGDFEKGTCYGEVAAVMIANQPGAADSCKKVMLQAEKMHIIFFQAMSNLRWLHQRCFNKELAKIMEEEQRLNTQVMRIATSEEAQAADAALQSVSAIKELRADFMSYFIKNQECERQALELLAKIKFIEQMVLSTPTVTQEKLEEVITTNNAQILRLTFPHSKDAHTICLFLHPRFQIYDSLVGMVTYETQNKLLIDVQTYFDEVNRLSTARTKKVTIEIFRRAEGAC